MVRKTVGLPVIEKLIIFGLPAISVLVWTASTLDPVNLPKLVLLGSLAFAVAPHVLHELIVERQRRRDAFVLLSLLSLTWVILAVFFSGSNPIQGFFGVAGRYTGALTYISFTILALVIYFRASEIFYHRILAGLMVAGVINVVYCGFVIVTGDDPIPWTSVYGNILGTFGNPNFISSFLGLFIIVVFSKLIENRITIIYRISGLIVIMIAFLEILDSKSRQGIIVTALGCGAVLVYRVKTSSITGYLKILVLGLFSLSGVLALLGMLQIGPLTSYVYKASVSIRGAYWRAGWETMLQNPFFGAGPDGFGDWYARVRDARAMLVPGPDVFTNSPHNVFIEQGANGGIPLFIGYLLTQLFVLSCGLRYLIKSKEFNYLFSASFFGWVGFTAQSLISINQIGLAVWGYVLGAMTVGIYYSSLDKEEIAVALKAKRSKPSPFTEYQNIFISIAGALGLALSLQPFLADAKWRTALESKELEKIVVAAEQWPQSTDRYIQVTKALFENKFEAESLAFARKGLAFNPNNARLWYFLYQLPGSTLEEKEMAVKMLKVLDPNFVVK